MSSKGRKPIDYNGNFGGGIFRSPEELAEERTALEGQADGATPEAPGAPGALLDDSEETSGDDSVLASYQATIIPTIRKVVKTPGREVSFVRLSPEEKGELAEIIHTFRRQGRKTTENEINRIAINYLLEDFRRQQEGSLLARTLAALRE